MEYRVMTAEDYREVFNLWMNTPGMGLNTSDDSEEGIHKVALVAFERNEPGNAFWESVGFTERDDLVYRNRNIHELVRIDTQ